MLNQNSSIINTPEGTPKKRPYHISPTEKTEDFKDDKKHKGEKMTSADNPVTLETIMASINSTRESIDKNSTILNDLQLSVSGIKEEIAKIDTKLAAISNDLSLTKKEVEGIKTRLDVVENAQLKQNDVNNELSASINTITQLGKASELSIHNLPPELEKDDIILSFASWSGLNLNEDSFKYSSLVKSKKDNTATLYLNFYQESLKIKFMNIVKSCQRDVNKKYIPLLCESVFELSRNNKLRGVELQFRNSMTNVNRNIFNDARKLKSVYCAVWLSQGNILVKEKEGDKPIRLLSMDHLKRMTEEIQSRKLQI